MFKYKVLNISEEGNGGGPHYRIAKISHVLKKNYEIETVPLIPAKSNKKVFSIYKKSKVKVDIISINKLSRDYVGILKYLLFFFKEIFNLRNKIITENFDIVHCNGSYQFKGIIACILTPSFAVWHLNDTYQPKSIRIIFNFLARHFCNGYIFASERTKKYYWKDFMRNKPNMVIPAPIKIIDNQSDNVSNPFDFKNKFIKIINVGFINPNKDLITLLKTVEYIIEQSPKIQIEVYIIGPVISTQQKYFDSLKSYISSKNLNCIKFLGFKENSLNYLRFADIYLCTSSNEASPTAVWEAMSVGLPIVSTDVSDLKLIFKEYNCGLISPVEDYKALGENLIKLYKNQNLRNKLSKKAKEAANLLFNEKLIAKKHSVLYEAILSRGK